MKFIATDSGLSLIHGLGDSPEGAIADARRCSGDPEAEYVTLQASDVLVNAVLRIGGGGNLNWTALDTTGAPIRQLRSNYDRCSAILDVPIDDEKIQAFQVEAGAAGDSEMVATCQRALEGDHAARELVWSKLAF